jgi:hypothetical protein
MKRILVGVILGALALAHACSGASGPTGGPVAGAADTHCIAPDGGAIVQPIDLSVCNATLADGGSVPVDYGDTRFNAESDDDDCKYHVKFTNTPVRQNENVTFTFTATIKADGGPAATSNLIPEVFLNSKHPAPNSGEKTTEGPAGTYAIGPIRFDAAGRWTVRFHLHQECTDAEQSSPHGHAAFFIDVP